MSDERPDLIALAGNVADGIPVNWPGTGDAAASRDDLELLEGLRLIERVAEVHASASASWSARASQTSSPLPAASPPRDPEQWGSLAIVERVGRGTFGTVYKAWDPNLERHVALKLLDRGPSDAVVNEGRLMARVRHPGVVTVHGADRHDGRVGIWMELIEGRTLEAEVCARGPLPGGEVALLGVQVADALTAVHRAGLIHRDVKAQNVMHQADGRVVLMDFGTGLNSDDGDASLAGTPLYLAPEIIEGGTATPRTDVYSLGVVLYHLATGSFPVLGRTLREIRRAHARGERRAVLTARPELAPALARLIDRAISPAPEDRFADAGAVAEALRRIVRAPVRRRQVAVLVALAAAMLVIGALTTWLWADFGSARSRLGFVPRDPLLITRFENHTGETVFDGAIEYALERALLESTTAGLVPIQRVHDALAMMRKPIDTIIDRGVGREVAIRDGGIKALIAGQISRAGPVYQITVELISPTDDRVAASFSEQANTRDQVSAALTRHAQRIRNSLGEHLAAIPDAGGRPEPATTGSLEAFQLYNQSHRLGQNAEWPASIAAARRAITADPEFASGWIWLAWGLSKLSSDPSTNDETRADVQTEMRSAAGRAVTLSQASPEWERLWIRGSAEFLRNEWSACVESFTALLTLRPDHYLAASHLYTAFLHLGRRGEANVLFSRIADLRPLDADINVKAAGMLLAAKRGEAAARPYVDRARGLLAESDGRLPLIGLWVALFDAYSDWLRRDIRSVQARVDDAVQRFGNRQESVRTQMAYSTGNFYLSLGQLNRAEEVLSSGHAAVKDRHLLWVAAARQDALELAPRLRRLEAGKHASFLTFEAKMPMLYISAGLIDDARRIVAELDPGLPAENLTRLRVDLGRGHLMLLDGKPQEAAGILEEVLRQFQMTRPHFSDYHLACQGFATALDRMGRGSEATRELETCATEEPYLAPLELGFFGTTAWMHTRLQLADAYRSEGRVSDAQAIESDLRALLAVADSDHPLVIKLAGR